MKLLRPIVIVLAWTFSSLLIAQTAAAAGKGGKGPEAAVAIDIIRLTDLQGGKILAEISGGGFLGGLKGARSVEVILDDVTSLQVTVHSAELLSAKIPGGTSDGDHTITVRTGDDNKQTASATIRLGGEMFVSCISWFVSGPADEHVHTEVHVEDENGNAVIGASVIWEAEDPSGRVYQTNACPTNDNDGHAHELTTCPREVSGS
ncbi:MAG: hypothetical protein V3W32_07210 [Gemmatimonadota bacterium]